MNDLLAGPQVSSLEARGRRQQKKGGSGMGSGGGNRRSKSENPLQRKLSVAQHLSLTTRPQVSVRLPPCFHSDISLSPFNIHWQPALNFKLVISPHR